MHKRCQAPFLHATALRYEGGDDAPRVAATGSGVLAEAIVAAAEQAGVPVRSDPALGAALSALKIDDRVPAELYQAVAEALVWAYTLTTGGIPPPCPTAPATTL